MSRHLSAVRPDPDAVLVAIADYVLGDFQPSDEALATARLCLMDSLGCAFMALKYPACTKLLGPVVPGATLPGGVRVPGTSFELEPVQAAFNIGAMIRWLDYNDTWLAAEWGHPSDNFGAILAVADYVSRQRIVSGKSPLTIREVLVAAIQAYEIQGVLALKNGFNRVGLDHVLLVRIASTAVAAKLLGADRQQLLNALSLAFVDGGALRTYRHAPNTGSRKSWAAGDATSRAVRLALIAMTGEMGYPSVLSAKTWGFQDSLFRGAVIELERPLAGYVMENILFKISFPAEFHAQTAVEAAIRLHPAVKHRVNDIAAIEIETQESGVRIIDKVGPLDNPADRDHCIQYMVAIPLIHGALTADHYENEAAADPRIDALRTKMKVVENERFSRDYLNPEKRSIANAVRVTFTDGSKSERVEVEYPVGHRRRRAEGTPLLEAKFAKSVEEVYALDKQKKIVGLFERSEGVDRMAISELMDAVWKGVIAKS